MKKGLLLIAAIIFIAFNSNAQILSEDFEGTGLAVNDDIALTGWSNVMEVGTRAWIYKEYNSNGYAQFSSYNSTEANEAWLITPAIDLTGYTGTSLSFDINVGYWKHAGFSVLISTDFAGTVSSANWTDVTSSFTIPTTPTDTYGTFATAGSMDLSSYSGMIYVAFKYVGDDNAGETTTFQVDNVTVTGTASVNNISSSTKLFPNPASSVLNVQSEVSISNISVANVIGQTVLNVNNVNADNYKLELNTLTNGVYLININNVDGTSSVAKFVKK